MGAVYYIGQTLGILATVGSVAQVQMKKRRQMLTVSLLVNALAAANVLCLQGFVSGTWINLVAVGQCVVSLYHLKKGSESGWIEKALFFALYVGFGMLGYTGIRDILPILAAVFYMVAVFQKSEQVFRLLIALNATTWIIYHFSIGSTLILTVVVSLISAVVGLIRFAKKEKKEAGRR